MDTSASDQFVAQWRAEPKSFKRAALTMERRFATTPEALFRLLCPTTERDWIPGWDCELLHSDSGYAEPGVVFRTSILGQEELWICTRYEPSTAIEYTRVGADFCARTAIELADNGDGMVSARWTVAASALTPRGNELLSHMDVWEQRLGQVLAALDYYVRTGKMVG